MIRLFNEMPDAQVVLALSPEELGTRLLHYLCDEFPDTIPVQHQQINAQNLIMGVPIDQDGRGQSGYPRKLCDQLQLAFSEAIAWLISETLLVPKPGENGWYCISRRGRSFTNEYALTQYSLASGVKRELLHPDLREKAWVSFLRQDYSTAIFQSMRAVEVKVREQGKYKDTDVGVPLMRLAFNKNNGALTDPKGNDAERDALNNLFAGAIGSYKNPHSHRNVPLNDPSEALEIIILASHLLKICDSRGSIMQQ